MQTSTILQNQCQLPCNLIPDAPSKASVARLSIPSPPPQTSPSAVDAPSPYRPQLARPLSFVAALMLPRSCRSLSSPARQRMHERVWSSRFWFQLPRDRIVWVPEDVILPSINSDIRLTDTPNKYPHRAANPLGIAIASLDAYGVACPTSASCPVCKRFRTFVRCAGAYVTPRTAFPSCPVVVGAVHKVRPS